jgi:hypothetical protein
MKARPARYEISAAELEAMERAQAAEDEEGEDGFQVMLRPKLMGERDDFRTPS